MLTVNEKGTVQKKKGCRLVDYEVSNVRLIILVDLVFCNSPLTNNNCPLLLISPLPLIIEIPVDTLTCHHPS